MSVAAASRKTPTGNIAQLLCAAAERAPARAAILTPEAALTYQELWARAASVAQALRAEAVQPGDRVAIFLERGPTAAAAYFGTLAVGAIAVMVNETLRLRQLEHILEHCGASLLATSLHLLERQPRRLEGEVRVLDLGGLALSPTSPSRSAPTPLPEPIARAPDELAQIIYTSGSTGLPKGVMVSHGNLWAALDTVTSYLGLNEDDRTASLLPFSSVYGINQLLCSIHRAATLIVADSPVPHETVALLRREAVTVLAAVPPLWLQLLSTPGFTTVPLDSLRILQNAGGHLPEPAVRQLRRLLPYARLYLQYGLTEVIRSTYLAPEEVDRRPGSMGRPIPGAEILVLREDLSPCGPGEVGELVHRGPTVTRGYWGDHAATELVFRPHPFVPAEAASPERVVFSGDLVRRDEEGFLYFVGRRDRMIKTLGYRVGPDEIASVLTASGEVREALVAGEPDAQRGERIVAYVVLVEGGSLRRLEGFCRLELPRHMQPARFELRSSLPRTSSGKHDLLALRRELSAC
jgi:amino acid adenylation domain-containing protein